jgi:uncharacterized protein (TIGR03083 family)
MDELSAFLDALSRSAASAPTRCTGWTTHDLLAHLVAGTEEMTRLIRHAANDDPASATRNFTEREAPGWRSPITSCVTRSWSPAGSSSMRWPHSPKQPPSTSPGGR